MSIPFAVTRRLRQVLTACLIAGAGTVRAALPRPAVTVSATIPAEVNVPVMVKDDPTAIFDDFSWQSFIALNWPAVSGQRGTADTARKIGSPGRVVWETWKADYELFQEHGAPPTEWASFDAHTPCKDLAFAESGRLKVLGSFSKFGDFNQAGFGDLMGPLVAQNQTYVRYEVRMDRRQYDFIRDNKLYLRANFPGPDAAPLRVPDNALELKAAWRIIKPDELAAATGRYYITKALVLDPVTNHCHEQDVALVGLHIVQKTPLRPQWIWSSFEHVDNAPAFGVAAPSGRFSFNDPAKTQALDPAKSPPPITELNPPLTNPTAMQVVRQKDIHPSTKETNAAYQEALKGTVWENYALVMTQWPTAPQPEDSLGAPFPAENAATNLANVTMETYFQKKNPPNTKATGCMKCHDAAREQKTDFVWFMHLRAFGEPSPASTKAVQSLKSLMLPD